MPSRSPGDEQQELAHDAQVHSSWSRRLCGDCGLLIDLFSAVNSLPPHLQKVLSESWGWLPRPLPVNPDNLT